MYPYNMNIDINIIKRILKVPRIKRIKYMGKDVEFFFDYEDIVSINKKKENDNRDTIKLIHFFYSDHPSEIINNFKDPKEYRDEEEYFLNFNGWGIPKSKNYFIPERKYAIYTWPYNIKSLPDHLQLRENTSRDFVYIEVNKKDVNISSYRFLDFVEHPINYRNDFTNGLISPETYSKKLIFNFKEFINCLDKYNLPIKEKNLNFNL